MFSAFEKRIIHEFISLSAQRQAYIQENSKFAAQPYEGNISELQRRIRERTELLTEDFEVFLEAFPNHILYMLYALCLIGNYTNDYKEAEPVDRYANAHAYVIEFDRIQAISKLKQFYLAEFVAKALKYLKE